MGVDLKSCRSDFLPVSCNHPQNLKVGHALERVKEIVSAILRQEVSTRRVKLSGVSQIKVVTLLVANRESAKTVTSSH